MNKLTRLTTNNMSYIGGVKAVTAKCMVSFQPCRHDREGKGKRSRAYLQSSLKRVGEEEMGGKEQ